MQSSPDKQDPTTRANEFYNTIVDSLRPLQVRAANIQAQQVDESVARVGQWEAVERPVLWEHAVGMKEAMSVLMREAETLKARVEGLEVGGVRNCPGTRTGFNVIRSRVDGCGRPLETEVLRKERERLGVALCKFDAEIAQAKAEIGVLLSSERPTAQEEVEIWETKLVAMQDTKRVYKEEINLIEVELLGREHYERMERDRVRAEETGLAQLKRLEEQELQTRIKYNTAKHKYYFPKEKGWNITFGGGGIFGACKDICISEIHGNLKIVAEPGEFGSKGPITPARVTVTFQAATNSKRSKAKDGGAGGGKKVGIRRSDTGNSSERTGMGSMGTKGTGVGNGRYSTPTAQTSNAQTPRNVSNNVAKDHANTEDNSLSTSTSAASFATTTANNNNSEQPPKGFAKRFLRRLGRKKEKYQSGKDPSELGPVPEDSAVISPAKGSLAKKLLGQSKRSGKGSKKHPSGDLDRLSFRGNRLETSSIGGQSALDDLDDLESFEDGETSVGGPKGQMSLVDRSSGRSSEDRGSYEGDSPLTKEFLEKIDLANLPSTGLSGETPLSNRSPSRTFKFAKTMSKGGWLVDSASIGMSESHDVFDDEATTALEVDDPDIDEANEHISEGERAIGGMEGVYCNGRLTGFELVGEKGSKVPNLIIGNADVSATVFVKFVFEYDKDHGWRPGQKPQDKPKFHVEKLRYSIEGNNVPMPPTLIKHILRVAIPGLIQRRLLLLLPKELGEYVQTARRGFEFDADVGLVGPALTVLDADIGFEIQGPERSTKEASKQKAKYEAAKEARNMLGLTLPQAQILSELFGGRYAMLSPPRPASISNLIALKARYDAHPKLFDQLCTVVNAAYHIFAKKLAQADVLEFSFKEFMDVTVSRVRKKPAKARVVVQNIDISVNADAVVTAIHDFTQRAIEELVIKGPMSDPSATLESMRDTIAEDLEVLHAWHVFALRELDHFKSKFKTAGGTVLLAADKQGVVAGIENSHYEVCCCCARECGSPNSPIVLNRPIVSFTICARSFARSMQGPLRLRLPLSLPTDQDGAISFEIPLPSPAGSLGVFMDHFKGLTVPCHLRPPVQAINWVELSPDTAINDDMAKRVADAIGVVQDVLKELDTIIKENKMTDDDNDPRKALTQPRTMVGDRLGKMIINRLKVKVRLDERRIGEIMSGLDSKTLGSNEAFITTAGRIISHLGDVMAFGMVPSSNTGLMIDPSTDGQQYVVHLESTDISRLRAEVQSLGFQSAITPGGAVRLIHALIRAAGIAFLGKTNEELVEFRHTMEGWYSTQLKIGALSHPDFHSHSAAHSPGLLTRDHLNLSMCIDTAGEVLDGVFIAHFKGTVRIGPVLYHLESFSVVRSPRLSDSRYVLVRSPGRGRRGACHKSIDRDK